MYPADATKPPVIRRFFLLYLSAKIPIGVWRNALRKIPALRITPIEVPDMPIICTANIGKKLIIVPLPRAFTAR